MDSKAEGQSDSTPFTFTATRTGNTLVAHTANWAVTGTGTNAATAADFVGAVLPSGTVSFGIGETSKTITVNVLGDTSVEDDEGFTVTLSNPSTGLTVGTSTAAGTITNDDASVAIAAASASKAEGHSGTTAYTFTATRSGDTSVAQTANWTVTGTGTNAATAADFVGAVLPSGTVSFGIGETSKTITVDVLGDTSVEDDEGFTVTLSNASTGLSTGTSTAAGTIINDDSCLAITATSSSKAEGTPCTFTVTRTGDTSVAHTVGWAISGSGTNAATAADFVGGVLPSGTVSFGIGETSKTITVNMLDDTSVEHDECFTVTLSNPSPNVAICTPAASVCILDDDSSVSITAASANKAEGNSGATAYTFTANRTGDTSIAQTANWAVTGSGANAAIAGDFVGGVLPSGTVSFAIGETSQTITVQVAGDTSVETDEGFTVSLSNASEGLVLGTSTATGTIINDDASSGSLILTPADGAAGDGFGFSVSLSADGRTAIVGGPRDDVGTNTDQGSARVFDWTGAAWVQRGGALTPMDGAAGDVFGWPVSLSADGLTAIVGGYLDDVGTNTNQGSARVFDWTGAAWVQRGGALTPVDGATDDGFGWSASLSADGLTAIVGGLTTRVFDWTGAAWVQRGGALTPVDGAVGDNFGISASLSADGRTAIVGAKFDDVGTNTDQGSARVFDWTGAAWVQRGAVLTATDGATDDQFGASVSLSADGRTAIVGGPGDDVGTNTVQGSARVFDWTGAAWVQRGGALTPVDGAAGDNFGVSASLSADGLTAIVGADSDDVGAQWNQGSAQVFDWTGWNQGSARVFDWTGAAWVQRGGALTAADGAGGDGFGFSVSLSADGRTAIVGGVYDDVGTNTDQGSARVFAWDGTAWVEGGPAPLVTSVSIAATTASKVEGNAGTTSFSFTATRTGDTSVAHTAAWTVTGAGTNPADAYDIETYISIGNGFTSTPVMPFGEISFAAGETTKTITVNVLGDTVAEFDETFAVTLSNPSTGLVLGTSTATGTIINDDSSVSITAASANKAEGNSGSTPFTFTATRTGDTSVAQTANWAVTGSGTNAATAADFVGAALPSGTVSFGIGETSQTITVNVLGETSVEADEGFTVTLSNPSENLTIGAGGGDTQFYLRITVLTDGRDILKVVDNTLQWEHYDFAAPGRHISVSDLGGEQPTKIEISQDGNNWSSLVNWFPDWLHPYPDEIRFEADSSLVTYYGAPGFNLLDLDIVSTLARGTISLVQEPSASNDFEALIEFNDNPPGGPDWYSAVFSVVFSLDAGTASGTIINDDASVSIAATSASKAEGQSGSTPFTFTATRTGDTTTAQTVNWAVTGSGTNAAIAADFVGGVLPTGTVSFGVGETSKTITVNVLGDTSVEDDEGFTVTLSNPSAGLVFGVDAASGTIMNDDGLPPITPINKKLFVFSANNAEFGTELWITDTTSEGTVLVKDIRPGLVEGGQFYEFALMGDGSVIFSVAGGQFGPEIWVTDGTEAGTYRAAPDIFIGGNPLGFAPLGDGRVLFHANDGIHGQELWITDGTEAGTTLVLDILPGVGNGNPQSIATNGGGTAVFSAYDAALGYTVWSTDGTALGTHLILDPMPGAVGEAPRNFFGIGQGRYVFVTFDGSELWELWSTDGSAAGTFRIVEELGGVGAGHATGFINVGDGRLLFGGGTFADGAEPWVTDGTSAGTYQIKDISPGISSSAPRNFAPMGDGRFLFSAETVSEGHGIWITDLTEAGTMLVADAVPGEFGNPSVGFTALGDGRAVFWKRGHTFLDGAELWVTDGTYFGTSRVANFSNSLGFSFFGGLSNSDLFTSVGDGRAIFKSPYDGVYGEELWVTDGTPAGTLLLADINSGTESSSPYGITPLGVANNWLSILATSARKAEGNSGATSYTFTATRTGDTSAAQTANWSVTGSGTNAANAADFQGGVLPSDTVTFDIGQATKTITVQVAGDTQVEADEGFTVTLSNPGTGLVLGTSAATGIIQNDDSSTPASPSVSGVVYHWKSHALLSGVTVSDENSGSGSSSTALEFRDVRTDASDNVLVDLWGNGASGVGNFGADLSLGTGITAAFQSSLPGDWTVLQNSGVGSLSLAGFGLTNVSGSTKLGTLTFAKSSAATPFSVSLQSGEYGTLTAIPLRLGYVSDITGTDGVFQIDLGAGTYMVDASRGVSDGGIAVSSADALAALKLAVGLNPNSDPDGTGPLQAMRVSPYQFLAADVNNSGTITAVDALGILKMAVRLADAPQAEWMFLREQDTFWNVSTNSYSITKSAVPNVELPVSLQIGSAVTQNLVGVLTGDVNGSWRPLDSSGNALAEGAYPALPNSYLANLSTLLGAPADLWGM